MAIKQWANRTTLDRHRIAPAIGDRHHRAALVGEQIAFALVADAGPFPPHLRVVHALRRAMRIAAQHGASTIVLGDQRIAVVEEAGDAGGASSRPAPAPACPKAEQKFVSRMLDNMLAQAGAGQEAAPTP